MGLGLGFDRVKVNFSIKWGCPKNFYKILSFLVGGSKEMGGPKKLCGCY